VSSQHTNFDLYEFDLYEGFLERIIRINRGMSVQFMSPTAGGRREAIKGKAANFLAIRKVAKNYEDSLAINAVIFQSPCEVLISGKRHGRATFVITTLAMQVYLSSF